VDSKAAPEHLSIRETLFGDLPLDFLASHSGTGEPWKSFADAKVALDRGDRDNCIRILEGIVSQRNLESRHYAQAWHFLRQLGVTPNKSAKELLGVVVEVGMEKGLDLLAAYPDLHARYYNFSGAGVVWERPDASLDVAIQKLLHAAQQAVNQIGPWLEPRPAPPSRGQVRINMLTPSGLHFGQASFAALAADRVGGPVVAAAGVLMKELIQKSRK
jgi:hypothetical protein